MNGYLAPKVLQLAGLILLVGAAVFWGVTGRESVLIMGAAMSLIGLGAYRGVADVFKQLDEHNSPPDEKAPSDDP